MVKYNETQLDQTFSALGDPTRRALLAHLADGECTVSKLADPFAISLPAISKHLKILERSGLVKRHRKGRRHIIQLQSKPMQAAMNWIERYRIFWERNLDALEKFLIQTHPNQGEPHE